MCVILSKLNKQGGLNKRFSEYILIFLNFLNKIIYKISS